MILVIDNYDSFTYNLVQYMGEVSGLEREIAVYRNDELSLDEVRSLDPKQIVISPGPCTPDESGISMDVVREFGPRTPILGVCLGHQAIAQAFGGKVIRAQAVVHGKTSIIEHSEKGVFEGIEQDFVATRYHSLVVDPDTLPSCFEILAWSKPREPKKAWENRDIMAIAHKKFPRIIGLQFHPESILTRVGKDLLYRFLSL